MLKNIYILIFCLIVSSNLWAQDGGDNKRNKKPYSEKHRTELLAPKQIVVRTNPFSKAIHAVITQTKLQMKRQGTKLLDEMGDLASHLCCLKLDDDDTSCDYDNPLETKGATADLPPPYEQTVNPEALIESTLMEANMRCLTLEDGGCPSLIEDDLKLVLEQYPGYQGKNYHSTILYQSLRRLYIQREKFSEALTLLESELKNMPFPFIEEHDPQAIVDYAKILQALGRSDEASTFLEQYISRKSRYYIRRQAALWRAQYHKEKGNTAEAESAYIEALITADHDPLAYLALIEFYFKYGNVELAQALTGVMNRVIIHSPQWQDYNIDELKAYIHDNLPEPLADYYYSPDDLMTAIKLWVGKGQLDESAPYWLPLMHSQSQGGRLFMVYGDDSNSLKKLLFDLVEQLSMSSDQQLQYYKTLYRHRRDWISDSFYLKAVEDTMFYVLTEEFKDTDTDQVIELAQFIVDIQRKDGLFERRLAHKEPLKALTDGYIKKGEFPDAIDAFIDLIQQYSWDNMSNTLPDLMKQLAPHMNEEEAGKSLKSMFNNFNWIYFSIPDMIDSLVKKFGEEVISQMIAKALSDEFDAINKLNLAGGGVGWFLNIPTTRTPRFNDPILTALLTHPKMKEEWEGYAERTMSKRIKMSVSTRRIKDSRQKKDSGLYTSFSYSQSFPDKLVPALSKTAAQASQLPQLLTSIGIQQHTVPGDGYCMWYALSHGLQNLGLSNDSASTLQQMIAPFTTASNYAPQQWGTSDHLIVAAQHFNVPVIEIYQTAADLLGGILYHPSNDNNSATTTTYTGQGSIEAILNYLHTQNTPPIIMINNIVSDSNEALVLSSTNHWSAGTWTPEPEPEPEPASSQPNSSFAPSGFQFYMPALSSNDWTWALFLMPTAFQAASHSGMK